MIFVRRALQFLGYVYLMRVPLLAWSFLLFLWVGSLPNSGVEPILRGVFDVAPDSPSNADTILQFGLVSWAALLVATSIGVSVRLVVCNADARFHVHGVELSPGLELAFRLVPLASVFAIVGTAAVQSESAPGICEAAGVLAGTVLWYFLTVATRNWLRSRHWRIMERFQAGAWIPTSERGYLNSYRSTIQGRHLFATYQLFLAILVYIIFGIFHNALHVPALSLILIVIALACWALSGLAFFLDRYRVPLLIPIVLLTLLSSLFRQSDYFYQGLPAKSASALEPGEVIATYVQQHPQKPLVVVATTGGGIQSAAWTVRVLSGLNDQLPDTFSPSVRLISAVSGGSVGAMYFAAAYRNGVVPVKDDALLQKAEQSSLDQVAWGLAYPDLLFALLPGLKGIDTGSQNPLIYMDRGRMLEDSWRSRIGQADATLSDWENDARLGLRPALIFNSTLVESGQRFLLATTSFPVRGAATAEHLGRQEFFSLYKDSDLRIRTAARLSATFPYVTPAARLLRTDSQPSKRGRLYQHEPHTVDGGYYDNYGMASLIDWLENGLDANPALKPKVLIIEIHASLISPEATPEANSYGALFQLTSPLQTIENVRDTGQLSHNELDESLIKTLHPQQICRATFEFKNTDRRGCLRSEPLNWHFTKADKDAIDAAWGLDSNRMNAQIVEAFLKGGACPNHQ